MGMNTSQRLFHWSGDETGKKAAVAPSAMYREAGTIIGPFPGGLESHGTIRGCLVTGLCQIRRHADVPGGLSRDSMVPLGSVKGILGWAHPIESEVLALMAPLVDRPNDGQTVERLKVAAIERGWEVARDCSPESQGGMKSKYE